MTTTEAEAREARELVYRVRDLAYDVGKGEVRNAELADAVIRLRDRLQAAEERVRELERTFLHDHKAGEENIDRCGHCGLDIRDAIHPRREQ